MLEMMILIQAVLNGDGLRRSFKGFETLRLLQKGIMNGANQLAGLLAGWDFGAVNLSQQHDSDNSIKKTNQLDFGLGFLKKDWSTVVYRPLRGYWVLIML